MKKTNLTMLCVIVLSGCRVITPSLSSTSSFTSSIPIPNDDFDPNINGRNILIEQTQEVTYAQITSTTLSPLPLSAINFQLREEVVPSYAVVDAIPGDFSNQTITFLDDDMDVTATLNQLTVGESLSPSATIDFLTELQPTDERFNAKSIETKIRNLSHVYLQSEYYWFNNYVLEETMDIQRYDNHVLYGEGSHLKTFQTEVSIPVSVDYQLHADASTIYEIRDETYPSGFFGARDQRYQAIRTSDNFKQALTLGPITDMLGMRKQWNEQSTIIGFPLTQAPEVFTTTLDVEKTQTNALTISFAIFDGETLLESDESITVSVTLQDQTWSPMMIQYHLWQPTMS